LRSDRPGGVDLSAHVRHFKWADVLVLDQVPEQLWCCLHVVLIPWC